LDGGISARTLVTATGLVMLVPAAIWAWAMKLWKPSPVHETAFVD